MADLGLRTAALVVVAVLLTLCGAPSGAGAMDVGWSRVDDGLLARGALDVAQDGDGFLWFATHRGLIRYDGERTLAVDPQGQRVSTWRVVAALGRVFASTRAGVLYVVQGEHLAPVMRHGVPVVVRTMTGDADALWVWSRDGLRRLEPDGNWVTVPREPREREWVYHLRIGRGGVFVAASHGLWHATTEGERLLRPGFTVDVAPLRDGRLAVQAKDLLLVDGDSEVVLLPHQNRRAMSLVARNDVLYLTYASVMFRVTLDGLVASLRQVRDGGAPLADHTFVDREGTLWLGAVRMMEPETRIWSHDDGVPVSGRWVTTVGDLAFVSSWPGTAKMTANGPEPDFPFASNRVQMVCGDAAGRALAFVGQRGLADLTAGTLLVPDVWGSGCGAASGGGVWLLGREAVWEVLGDEITARPHPTPGVFRAIVESSDGTLVAAGGTTVCEAPVDAVRAGDEDAWQCTELPEAVGPNLVCAVEARPGVVRLCSEGDGVWERSAPHTWAPSPLNELLQVRAVINAEPSERGGMWIQQGDRVVRVEPNDGGWTLVEQVDEQVGMADAAADVDEDAEGNLWLATPRGVAFVPAALRSGQPPEFPPRLIAASVDGATATEPFVVPAGGAAELQFAALAYRYPHTLRYRWRLGDGAWSSPTASGTIRLAGLAAGAVGLEVATRVEGGQWSEPVGVQLRVRPPWYREPWFWLLVSLLIVAAAWGVSRVRQRMALAAERQRTRIAMDLHDELGAGLGSISILAGLLTSDRVPQDKAREAAQRIATSAEELGGSVTDIVWSLRSEGHDLAGLVVYLRERAPTMLDRERMRFRCEVPNPLPDVALPADVARGIQLVVVEALFNASRHSGASAVVLQVQAEPRALMFSVRDNGVGLDGGPTSRPGGGNGLLNMKRRAKEIGAALMFDSPPDGGTEVTLIVQI